MDMPDLGDEADAPIIVPKPGQILRRSARTKIRKAGQTGEGAHRFQTRSRRISGPQSTSIDSHPDQVSPPPGFDPELSPEFGGQTVPRIGVARPESFSDESFIYDAYAEDNPVESVPVLVSQPPQDNRATSPPSVTEFDPQQLSPIQPHNIPIPPTPTLHHPQPRHHLSPTTEPQPPSRTPSPDASSITLVEAPHRASDQYHSASTPSLPTSQDRKEKDKGKKGFFGWGGEKGKKGAKEKEKEKEKEKDSSFLGSLFGGSKKKHDEFAGTGLGSGSGRETAAALLGASKSRSRAPSPTPQAGGPYARYPIHVERAIYRLSHIKLANPRRPLYEQVLISNLMFWYLGVINNKGQTNGSGQKESQQQQGTGQQPQGGGQDANPNLEKERKEQEEREKAERERIELEKEREKEREREKEFLAQQQQQPQKREPKRGPLTKPGPGPPGQRRAEMPVRGPQYEMQQRMMEQEYGGYDRSSPQNRPGAIYNPGPQFAQGQPHTSNSMPYHNPGNPPGPNGPSQRPSSPQLPPGAMSPINDQAPWNSQVRYFSLVHNLIYKLPFVGWSKEV